MSLFRLASRQAISTHPFGAREAVVPTLCGSAAPGEDQFVAIATAVCPHTDRDEHLWKEELARVTARRYTMTPVAAAAVESVLRAILSEQAEDDSLAFSTLAALEEVREPPRGRNRRGWSALRLTLT